MSQSTVNAFQCFVAHQTTQTALIIRRRAQLRGYALADQRLFRLEQKGLQIGGREGISELSGAWFSPALAFICPGLLTVKKTDT